jgi:hypothetical protein
VKVFEYSELVGNLKEIVFSAVWFSFITQKRSIDGLCNKKLRWRSDDIPMWRGISRGK